MVRQIRYYFNLHNDYLALHYAHQYRHISFLTPMSSQHVQEFCRAVGFEPTALQAAETIARYARINEMLLERCR